MNVTAIVVHLTPDGTETLSFVRYVSLTWLTNRTLCFPAMDIG